MKKKQLEADIFIGKFQLGWQMVNLYVMPRAYGGWFNVNKDGRSEAEMHIGLAYDTLPDAYAVLVHEAQEFAANEQQAVFVTRNAFCTTASDAVHFQYDHNKHTEICQRCAYFYYHVWEEIEKWWKLAHPGYKENQS